MLCGFSFASDFTQQIEIRTGKDLAVLEFEGKGLSQPLTRYLTQEFRQVVKSLDIYVVQDSGITNQLDIFQPQQEAYWSCWELNCVIQRGQKLNVNWIIAGNIEKVDEDEFQINGRLYSIDMESMENEFSLRSSGLSDSLLMDMKRLAYNVNGLPAPDTLSVGSDTSQVAISEDIKRGWKLFELPNVPTKIKALMMSTALPGSGQIWVDRKYPGYSFMGTEATLGLVALYSYLQYENAWGGFDSTYTAYRAGMDPHELLELRPQIIQYAADTKRYNDLMRNIRNIGLSIWVTNMVHAYLVAPSDDFFDGQYFFDVDFDPSQQQIKAGISVPLDF